MRILSLLLITFLVILVSNNVAFAQYGQELKYPHPNLKLEQTQNSTNILPPLKQFKSGAISTKVKCTEGLQLIFKAEDNSPACVKPQTAQKLLERGWTQPIANTSPEYSVLTNNSTENSSTGTMNVTYARLSVNYTVTNAKIFNFKYDPEDISINTRFQANGDGNLTILIPRALLDARINNLDYQFIIFDNGHEINFKEIKKTSIDRTLSIPFVQGDNQIEIIGANPD